MLSAYRDSYNGKTYNFYLFNEVNDDKQGVTLDKPNKVGTLTGDDIPRCCTYGGRVFIASGGKLQYYNSIVGGAIDARFMPAILKGIMEKMDEGPLTGSYARDIRVVIYDGKMHPVDSNEISFKLAARNAFKEAFRNAGPKIMEPIYNVEVLVPTEYMGSVMSDLQNRRAMIMGMESDKGFDRLNARVPLAELYRYSTTLSSLTSGAATYTMRFDSYEQVPSDVQEKLLKAYTDTDEE